MKEKILFENDKKIIAAIGNKGVVIDKNITSRSLLSPIMKENRKSRRERQKLSKR